MLPTTPSKDPFRLPAEELSVVNVPVPAVTLEAVSPPEVFVVIAGSILIAEFPFPKTAALFVSPVPVTFPLPLLPPVRGGGGTALICVVISWLVVRAREGTLKQTCGMIA
jgi:hypothetical protein